MNKEENKHGEKKPPKTHISQWAELLGFNLVSDKKTFIGNAHLKDITGIENALAVYGCVKTVDRFEQDGYVIFTCDETKEIVIIRRYQETSW